MFKGLTRLVSAAILVLFVFVARPAFGRNYRYDFAVDKYFDSPYTGGQLPDTITPAIQANINGAWRSLMSEMGAILAPQFLSPAETVGWNGFVLDFKYGFTSLSHSEDFWKYGVHGSPNPVASTVSLEARKGIWMPLPSFELGGGFTHLVDSHMFTVNLFAKFALHEGYHHWITPALAVRGYFQRLLGANQINMTILSADVSASKSFGIAGSFNMTPYLGYNVFWVIARSDVMDYTPGIDALQESSAADGSYSVPLGPGAYCNSSASEDCGSYYVFMDQKAILRHRLFFGLRFHFTLNTKLRFMLSTEYATTIRGVTDDSYQSGTTTFSLKDDANMQHTWSFSLGIDY